MPAFLAPLLISAGSAIASALSNRGRKVETQSTSTPTFAPEFQQLLTNVAPHLLQRIQNPQAGMEDLRVAGRDQINADYANVPQLIAQKYGRNAHGTSGLAGGAAQAAEFNRLGSLAGFEQQLLREARSREDGGIAQILQLLSLGRGQQTTGTQQLPGNVLGGAAESGLDAALFLNTLSRLTRGGGSMGNT